MYANFEEKRGDGAIKFRGHVVNILPSNDEEAFILGRIFERIYATGNLAWPFRNGISIPLLKAPQNDVETKPEQPTTNKGCHVV